MLSHSLLLFLSVLGTLASPTPTATDSLSILAARGIDPAGPIPADATPLPDGGFSFAADSDAAHWSRAQSLPPSSPLSKRALSGLSMTMWEFSSCTGSGAFFGNVAYGVKNIGSILPYKAIQYNGRALLDREVIDFYQANILNGDKCYFYLGSYGQRHPAGCSAVNTYSCFKLSRP